MASASHNANSLAEKQPFTAEGGIAFKKDDDLDLPTHELPTQGHSNTESETASNYTSEDLNGGSKKIEALYIVFGRGWKIWALWASIGLVVYAYSLSSNTTYVYEPFSTSAYGAHTVLGTISVVTGLMSSVGPPFIAKLADLTSRPFALTFSLAFYCLGFILIASSPQVGTVVAGQVFATVGTTGFNILVTILIGDLTSMQWRGMVQAATSAPYIINAFVAGYISEGVSLSGWRWGYGMFVIILPVLFAPALFILFWADWKAKKLGALSLAASSWKQQQHVAAQKDTRSWLQMALFYWSAIDAFGLILLGAGWVLVLLPFTLYTRVEGGFANGSMIAMFVVGGVCLIAFGVWDTKFAKYPLQPMAVLNRSFICCIVIDFMYYFSSYIGDTYFNSWVYIVKDEWSTRDYTFYINTVGVALCAFAFIPGFVHRYTHNYKWLQLSGLGIRIIGQALKYHAAKNNPSDAVLVMAQILCGLGGSFSVIGSQVASQASVPHKYMGLVIALLSLWTNIGGAIGSAISAALWNDRLPRYLQEELGSVLNSTQIADIYGSIVVARLAEPRELVVRAYQRAICDMLLPSVILCFVPLIAGCFTSNFYLDDKHNAIEETKIVLTDETDMSDEAVAKRLAEARALRHK